MSSGRRCWRCARRTARGDRADRGVVHPQGRSGGHHRVRVPAAGRWVVKRSAPLTSSREQIRVWQQRSQRAAIARAQQPPAPDTDPTSPRKRKKRRRNDSQWRADCLELRGEWCRVPECPHPQPVEMDHLISRGQGGPSVVQNGLPLCRVHHQMKTDHLLLIAPEWLAADMILWLSNEGHAEWLYDGIVVGRHRKIFADGTPDRSML